MLAIRFAAKIYDDEAFRRRVAGEHVSDVTSTKTLKYKYEYKYPSLKYKYKDKYLFFLQLHINYSSKDDVKIVLSCKLTNQKQNCCRLVTDLCSRQLVANINQ